MKIDGIATVEEAMKYKNTILYIKREDADIGDRYFIQELIGCSVYHSETKELLGKITDVTQLPANDIWHISKDGKEYLYDPFDGKGDMQRKIIKRCSASRRGI